MPGKPGRGGLRYVSPLRYLAGQGVLASFLARTIETIEENGLSGCTYFETSAGGTEAELGLRQFTQ